MTHLLEKAFTRVGKLARDEQNAIARWLLTELASQKQWDKLLGESSIPLATLADEALLEHKQKKTRPLDPESL